MISVWFSLALGQTLDGSGFDAHGFRLAAHDADPRDPLVGWRPGTMGPHSWFASGVLEYASEPLVFKRAGETFVELDDLIALNSSIGYAPHPRVRVDLAMPVYFYSALKSGPIGAGLGDMRATTLISLLDPEHTKVGLGVVANLDLPTGSAIDYRGQTTVAGGVGLAVTAELDRLTLSGSASSQLRPNTAPEDRPAPTQGGDAFTWAASVGYLVTERAGITLEAYGEVASDTEVRNALGVPVEAILSMKHVAKSGGFLTAGMGVGLTRGAGASPFRILVGGGFGRVTQVKKDMDGDGFGDFDDLCPASPETVNGYKDLDGCPDELPKIVFRAIDPGGEYREDATIDVRGPVDQKSEGQLMFQGEGVVPGTEWHVDVAVGHCLEGSADVTMGPDGDVVDVVLERRRTARVLIEAVGADGAPLQDAVVAFRTEETPCAPSLPSDLGDGTAEVSVGPGMFFAFISAPGFNVYQEMFEIEEGGSVTIRAVLEPSLAVLVQNDDGSRTIGIRQPIEFEAGKAELLPESLPVLDEVLAVAIAEGVRKLEVAAHTDDQGPNDRNQSLTQQRAEAVVAYLVSGGLPPDVAVALGYGETVPLVSNGTREGRETNRRIEFKVLQ